METKIYKRIAKNGSITLPRRIREELGMYSGTGIAIDIVDGQVVINKSAPGCILCGSADNLIECGAHNICSECAKSLAKELE